jgi:hypothetical protein
LEISVSLTACIRNNGSNWGREGSSLDSGPYFIVEVSSARVPRVVNITNKVFRFNWISFRNEAWLKT